MKHIFLFLTLFTLIFGSALSAQAAFFSNADNVTFNSPIAEDAYIFGKSIRVSAPVSGDIFALGQGLILDQRGGRSLFAASAGDLEVGGTVYNAYLAGNTITLKGEYGKDVYVVGNRIRVAPGTIINGDLRVGGAIVTLEGKILGNVYASVSELESKADISGSMKVNNEQLRFTGGTVGGDLIYTADESASGLDKIIVNGKTQRKDPPVNSDYDEHYYQNQFLGLLSSLLLGLLLVIYLPQKSMAVVSGVMENYRRSWAVGASAFIVFPLLALLLAFTLIGLTTSIVLILVYIILVIMSSIYSSLIIGLWLLKRSGDATPALWAAVLVGVTLSVVAVNIPLLGVLAMLFIAFGLIVPTMGSLLIWYRSIVR